MPVPASVGLPHTRWGPYQLAQAEDADAQQEGATSAVLVVSHLDDKPGRNAGDGALRRPEAGEEATR